MLSTPRSLITPEFIYSRTIDQLLNTKKPTILDRSPMVTLPPNHRVAHLHDLCEVSNQSISRSCLGSGLRHDVSNNYTLRTHHNTPWVRRHRAAGGVPGKAAGTTAGQEPSTPGGEEPVRAQSTGVAGGGRGGCVFFYPHWLRLGGLGMKIYVSKFFFYFGGTDTN